MDKALSFFRVFDLAFFLPGFVLVQAGVVNDWLTPLTANTTLGIASTDSALEWLILIAGSYLVGLLVHASGRLLWGPVEWLFLKLPRRCKHVGPSWYASAGEEQKAELSNYFWYTRAICFNGALVCLVVAVHRWQWDGVLVGYLVAVVALVALAFEYDGALGRVSQPQPNPTTKTPKAEE